MPTVLLIASGLDAHSTQEWETACAQVGAQVVIKSPDNPLAEDLLDISVLPVLMGDALQQVYPEIRRPAPWAGSRVVLPGSQRLALAVAMPDFVCAGSPLRGQWHMRPHLAMALDGALREPSPAGWPGVSLVADLPLPVRRLSLDLETIGKKFNVVELAGLCADGHNVLVLDGSEWKVQTQDALDQCNMLVCHNAKFDVPILEREGLRVPYEKLWDTMQAQRMLAPDGEVSLGASLAWTLAGRWTYHKPLGREDASAERKGCLAVWQRLVPALVDMNYHETQRFYNALDCASTWRLQRAQELMMQGTRA